MWGIFGMSDDFQSNSAVELNLIGETSLDCGGCIKPRLVQQNCWFRTVPGSAEYSLKSALSCVCFGMLN